ncbi:hypothetical protein PM082_023019 [Marasmius tenuissimus]|nr:hypothetical protein PM082_023019 [Marasmius tenuissimus]
MSLINPEERIPLLSRLAEAALCYALAAKNLTMASKSRCQEAQLVHRVGELLKLLVEAIRMMRIGETEVEMPLPAGLVATKDTTSGIAICSSPAEDCLGKPDIPTTLHTTQELLILEHWTGEIHQTSQIVYHSEIPGSVPSPLPDILYKRFLGLPGAAIIAHQNLRSPTSYRTLVRTSPAGSSLFTTPLTTDWIPSFYIPSTTLDASIYAQLAEDSSSEAHKITLDR